MAALEEELAGYRALQEDSLRVYTGDNRGKIPFHHRPRALNTIN